MQAFWGMVYKSHAGPFLDQYLVCLRGSESRKDFRSIISFGVWAFRKRWLRRVAVKDEKVLGLVIADECLKSGDK